MNRLPLFLILALSGLLAIGYARVTPIGAAPDEGAHLRYVEVIATEGQLPVLNTREPRRSFADPDYESHQPPLYYALAAPFYLAGRALDPNSGPGQACRALSILLGLAGTALVWLLAAEIAPGRPALRIGAAAIAGFLPMRLHIMAAVGNDTLAEATGSLALLILVRAVRGPWNARRAAGLGAALGLALLAKQSSILLLPPALLGILLASRFAPASEAGKTLSGRKTSRKRNPSPAAPAAAVPAGPSRYLKTGLAVLAVALSLSGWWYVRNQVLYGDPLAKRAFEWYFSDTTRWEHFRAGGFTFDAYLSRKVLPSAWGSFWGAFGHLDPNRPQLWMGAYGSGPPGVRWGYPPRSWLYPQLFWLVCLSLAGPALYGLRRLLRARAPAASARDGTGTSLLALHAVFVCAGFLNFNTIYFQAQGRYLFPAIAITTIGMTAGWLEWARFPCFLASRRAASWQERARRWELALAFLIAAGILALAVYALVGVVEPVFRSGA